MISVQPFAGKTPTGIAGFDDIAGVGLPRGRATLLVGDPLERIRQALAKDDLTLYCQPIVALDGDAGFPMAEVLVRLRELEACLGGTGKA